MIPAAVAGALSSEVPNIVFNLNLNLQQSCTKCCFTCCCQKKNPDIDPPDYYAIDSKGKAEAKYGEGSNIEHLKNNLRIEQVIRNRYPNLGPECVSYLKARGENLSESVEPLTQERARRITLLVLKFFIQKLDPDVVPDAPPVTMPDSILNPPDIIP